MNESQGIRYARKTVNASCLLLHRGQSCISYVKNISASGILIELAGDECIKELKANAVCILEIVVNESLNLHVSSSVIRITGKEIALHYISIPEDKQVSLWQLLGDHVHEVETFAS